MFRKFLCYGGFSLATTLFGVLSLPVLTNFLSPSEYGVLGISLTILALLVPLNTLSNEHNVQATKTRANSKEYSHYLNALCSLSFLIFIGGLLLVIPLVYLFDFPKALFVIPFLSFVRGLRLIKQAELVVSDKDFLYGISSFLIAVFAFTITILIFYFYNATATLRVVGLLFAELFVVLFVMKLRFSFVLDNQEIKKAFLFGFPLIISILPAWLINESSRFFLLQYGSLEVVGLFTLSFQISVIYLQFNTVLANTYVKKILKNIEASFKPLFIIKITSIQIFCALIFCVAINYFGVYFLPNSYMPALTLANFLIVGVLFQSFGMLPSYYLSYHNKNKFRLYALIVAGTVAVMLNFYLVPLYGSEGAAASFVSAMLLYCISISLYVYLLIKKHI